jgi:uncharacterized glyoxalase superfamily protein PhnB
MTDGDRPNIFPALRYRDPASALDWLKRAFGFREKVVYRGEDGTVHHAELQLGAGIVMFGEYKEEGWMGGHPPDALASTVSVYVVVEDPDAHHERAALAGATIVRGLVDQDYGSREYSARDLEGTCGRLAPTILRCERIDITRDSAVRPQTG